MTSLRKSLDLLGKTVRNSFDCLGKTVTDHSKKVGDKTAGLARKHKIIIHCTLFLAITVSLCSDGAKSSDWLFLVLSVVVEVS